MKDKDFRGVMGRLTLNTLISGAERRLEIFYIGCVRSMQREVHDPVVHRCRPVEPPAVNSVLILDPAMLAFVMCDPKRRVHAFFDGLKAREVCFVALSDGQYPPREWFPFFERLNIPWCVSHHDPYLLESRLQGLIRERVAGNTTIHAGLIEIDGWGILLTGEAGSGKTRLAIEVMQQGHGWIADDVVILKKRATGVLMGSAHKKIKGVLHLREKGIHDVTAYGKGLNVREEAVVKLIVVLPRRGSEETEPFNASAMQDIMGMSIPVVHGRLTHDAAASAREIIKIVHQRQRVEACG